MPKRDLAKALGGERFTTQQKVEVHDPLAVATEALKDASVQETTQDVVQGDVQTDKDVRMHARTPDSSGTSTQVSRQTRMSVSAQANVPTNKLERKQGSKNIAVPVRKEVNIEVLYDQICQRKHLSNSSFRYHADELETFDAIYKELEEQKPGRISRNDIARMALIEFCRDYQENGERSVLMQVFKRM